MTVYVKAVVDASGGQQTLRDIRNFSCKTGISRDAGHFTFTIDDESGDSKALYSVGDNVSIYEDRNANPTTKIFAGFIEDIKHVSKPSRESLTISGKNYQQRLLDATITDVYYDKPDYYVIINILDKEGGVTGSKLLSNFDTVADWAEDGATDSLNPVQDTTYRTEGSYCLKLGIDVSQSVQTYAHWTNTLVIGSIKDDTNNGTEGKIGFQVYVPDAAKLAAADNLRLYIGSAAGDHKYWNVTLATGWNNIFLDVDSPDGTAGSIDWDAIDWMRVRVNEAATPGDTEIYMDNLRVFRKNRITYENLTFGSNYTISQKGFKHRVVHDAIKEIAKDAGYDFWVDTNIDFNYAQEEITSSGATLDNTNVWNSTSRESRQSMYNKITVYGGRYKNRTDERFTADGGSVFTLQDKPYNAYVTVGNCPAVITNTKKLGWLLADRDNADPGSVDYWLDSDNKNLIFSGTVPTSGTQCIFCAYDRTLPVIKQKADETSINTYGLREKLIVNEDITDPRQAKEIVKSEIALYKDPQTLATLQIETTDESFSSLTPGQMLVVNLPNENINNKTFKILDVSYSFNTATERSERHMTVQVSQVIKDTVNILKDTLEDIRKLKARDINIGETMGKLRAWTGSAGFQTSGVFMRKRFIYDSFCVGHAVNGIVGTHGTPLDYFHAVGNWTGNTGSRNAALSIDQADYKAGSASMLGIFAGSGYTEVKDDTTALGDLSLYTGQNNGTPTKGMAGIHLKTSDWDLISGNVKFRFGSSNTDYAAYNAISNGFVYSGTNTTGSYHKGWGYYTFDLDDPSAVSGTPDWTNTDYSWLAFEFTKAGSINLDYYTIASGNTISLNGVGDRRSGWMYHEEN